MKFKQFRLGFGKRAADDGPLAPGAHLLVERGLLASWYINHRLGEEVERARVHGRPLAVLLGQPQLLRGEMLSEAAIEATARAATKAARESDVVGWSDDGGILVVMPETAPEAAVVGVSRWRDEMWLLSRALGGQKWAFAMIDDVCQSDLEKQTARQLVAGLSQRLWRYEDAA